jgi:hypothetical protein
VYKDILSVIATLKAGRRGGRRHDMLHAALSFDRVRS